jgi:hypothetical protein
MSAMESLVEAILRAEPQWERLAPPRLHALLEPAIRETPPMRPVAIQLIAAQLHQMGEWLSAGHLAAALWSWMRKNGQLDVKTPPIPLMGANLATFAASTLVDAGAPAPVIEQGPTWLAWLEAGAMSDAAGMMRLHLGEAAMESGALEKAATWLDEYARQTPTPDAHPVYTRLRGVLDDLLRAVDQPDQPAPSFEEIVQESLSRRGSSRCVDLMTATRPRMAAPTPSRSIASCWPTTSSRRSAPRLPISCSRRRAGRCSGSTRNSS